MNKDIDNLKYALSLVGVQVNDFTADLILNIISLLNKKKDLVTLRDIKKVNNLLTKKHTESTLNNALLNEDELFFEPDNNEEEYLN